MYLIALLLLSVSASAEGSLRYANHIFNAVHSSMRQWGSSVNHNGMSVFPAMIPAGTKFYHGGPKNSSVKGMEWLAFEPEHASFFAWSLENYTGPVIIFPDVMCFPQPYCKNIDYSGDSMPATWASDTQQSPLTNQESRVVKPGYLHTYAAKRDLNVVYIDGQSAGKSSRGTTDFQELILAMHYKPSPIPGDNTDFSLVRYLCKTNFEFAGKRVDGFIRMEPGFELIMCDFEDGLDTVAIRRMNKKHIFATKDVGFYTGFYQSVASRYHGIGGGRVILDYENMVTAYVQDIDLFPSGAELPRLTHVPANLREGVFDQIIKSLKEAEPIKSINWQVVADLIVARYSDRIYDLAWGNFESKEHLDYHIKFVFRTFQDDDYPDEEKEIEACTLQYLPSKFEPSTAAIAVQEVAHKICSTYSTALKLDFEDARAEFRNLVEYLQWTNWKYCHDCAIDEVCFVAIWPFGDVEDHYHPSCKNGSEIFKTMQTSTYWNFHSH